MPLFKDILFIKGHNFFKKSLILLISIYFILKLLIRYYLSGKINIIILSPWHSTNKHTIYLIKLL